MLEPTKNIVFCDSLTKVDGLVHGFGTRLGGISQGPYTSANMKSKSNDLQDNVEENRRLFCESLEFSRSDLVMMLQTHSSNIFVIDEHFQRNLVPKADALITNKPGYFLGVLTADCVPILLADPSTKSCAAIHAGWRGAAGNIIENTMKALVQFGVQPSNCIASIGPSISKDSYEVGLDVLNACQSPQFFEENIHGRWQFDLKGLVQSKLRNVGLQHIVVINHDTYMEKDLFFSCRRSSHWGEADYGNHMSVIGFRS